MSDNVFKFPARGRVNGNVDHVHIWGGEEAPDGSCVVLVKETWADIGTSNFVVMCCGPYGEDATFEPVCKFPAEDQFIDLAKFSAGIADKSIGTYITLLPEEGE